MTIHSVRARLSLVFSQHNKISDREYWASLIFTVSNRGGSDRLPSRLGRVKLLVIHLTPQEHLARWSLEPSDNRALAVFGQKREIRPKISPIILYCVPRFTSLQLVLQNWRYKEYLTQWLSPVWWQNSRYFDKLLAEWLQKHPRWQ